jgi:hypothetical protein
MIDLAALGLVALGLVVTIIGLIRIGNAGR